MGNKIAKSNPDKVELFAESVDRNFGIDSQLFSNSHFDRINRFVEAHSYHFTPLNSLNDISTDTDDDSDLVADVDPDSLIRIVRSELKVAVFHPGLDKVYNEILKKEVRTGFYTHLAQDLSLKLGYIPYVWKTTVLCMLFKPDKRPSQTTSYRPISLLSAIMKCSELKRGNARGLDQVCNEILNKAIGTGFYTHLARDLSLKLGYIPYVWKTTVLCMLIKPDKPPSQTTSYRPISLLSAIMKLFEWVIEERLRKHLEENSSFSKYQSGFKSTIDQLFRLSQTIVESFNRVNM